jgi:hypothetical protein
MSSASSGSQNNGGPFKPAANDVSPPRAADSSLLERVLRQTQEIFGTAEPLDRNDLQALRDVAARYRGRPLELEPMAVELVAAAIGGICPSKKNTEFWRHVTVQVASILMNDPTTFARMNALWIRLGGV